MFVFIDIKFAVNDFQDLNDLKVEGINTLMTDFKDTYKRKYTSVANIQNLKRELEDNVIISFCSDLELAYLTKYGINPQRYVDLYQVINRGSLIECCQIFSVPFDTNNVCQVMYELALKNLNKVVK